MFTFPLTHIDFGVQDVTKAAVRACRNAIEFNSIPSITAIIPGGYADMALRVTLAIPSALASSLDLDRVKAVFPYGRKEIVVTVSALAALSKTAFYPLTCAFLQLRDPIARRSAHRTEARSAEPAAAIPPAPTD